MADTFTVRIAARGYEVDSNGHVAGTTLMQYSHSRLCIRSGAVRPGPTTSHDYRSSTNHPTRPARRRQPQHRTCPCFGDRPRVMVRVQRLDGY